MDRAIPYTTSLHEDFDLPAYAPAQLQTSLQEFVRESSALKSKDKINVTMDGNVVVLRGEVASLSERGLVERMLRMEPGVRDVNNQLTVAAKGKQ